MATLEHFAALRARAQRMERSRLWLWGCVAALVGVGAAWFALGSLQAVADRSYAVVVHVFVLLLVLAVAGLEYGRRLSQQLAHLRQTYYATPGLTHSERDVAWVKYDFAAFTLADFETHRRLWVLSNWEAGAFMAFITWAGLMMFVP